MKQEHSDRIGSIIKTFRIAQNATVDDLASYIGKDRSTVYRYERGAIADVPLKTMYDIADFLHMDISVLLGIREPDAGYDDLKEAFDALNPTGQAAAISMVRGLADQFGKKDTSVKEG